MKRVFLISPFAGEVAANVAYARQAMRDCLRRGEAPFASHLLYPQCLDDDNEEERALGMAGGAVYLPIVDAAVCYVERGISRGMRAELMAAFAMSTPIVWRSLQDPTWQPDERWFSDQGLMFLLPSIGQ